ncbi:unnamed protein product, partial [marine sediment metagenome]
GWREDKGGTKCHGDYAEKGSSAVCSHESKEETRAPGSKQLSYYVTQLVNILHCTLDIG